ncbi:hypothetical protein OS493_039460, partial [Desmophyllum pertusum]
GRILHESFVMRTLFGTVPNYLLARAYLAVQFFYGYIVTQVPDWQAKRHGLVESILFGFGEYYLTSGDDTQCFTPAAAFVMEAFGEVYFWCES